MNVEEREEYDKLIDLPLAKLMEEFDKTCVGGSIRNQLRYDVIRGIISDRLGLIHRNEFGTIFATELDELSDRITELENKFRTHRHDTSKLYSGRPEW